MHYKNTMKEKDGVFIPKSKSPLYGEEIRVNLNYKTTNIKDSGDIIRVFKESYVNIANLLKIDNK